MDVTGRLVVAEAMAELVLARVKMHFPFRWAMVEEAPSREAALDIKRPPNEPRVRAVGKLLDRARKRLPWKSTCLVTALAARAMLRRRRVPSVLRFGMRRGEDGRLSAHAWLEAGGGVVCGGPAAEGYVHLAGFSQAPIQP